MHFKIRALACALVITLVFLNGCAAQFNPQAYSGIAHIEITFDENGQIGEIKSIEGKEFGTVSVSIKNSDGSVIDISESDVAAFTGQELQSGLIDLGFDGVSDELINAILQIVNRGRKDGAADNI